MSRTRYLMAVLLIASAGLAQAQPPEPAAESLREIRATMGWPETLVIRVTGLFQSPDDGRVALITWAPLVDDTVLDRWCLVEGAQYQYEVSLRTDGGTLLRSLSCVFMAEEPATALAPVPTSELMLRGYFTAPREGRLFPDFTWEGEAERDCTVRLLVLPMPPACTIVEIERPDPPVTIIYQADPWATRSPGYFDSWNWSWSSPYPYPPPRRRYIDRPDPPSPPRIEREKPRFGTVSPTPPRRDPEPPPPRTDDEKRQPDPPQEERESPPPSRTQRRPGG